MDIADIKKIKVQSETDLLKIFNDFESKTDLRIDDIRIERNLTLSRLYAQVYAVTIRLGGL